MLKIIPIDCLNDFIGFLEQILAQRFMCLLYIPRTAVSGPFFCASVTLAPVSLKLKNNHFQSNLQSIIITYAGLENSILDHANKIDYILYRPGVVSWQILKSNKEVLHAVF